MYNIIVEKYVDDIFLVAVFGDLATCNNTVALLFKFSCILFFLFINPVLETFMETFVAD